MNSTNSITICFFSRRLSRDQKGFVYFVAMVSFSFSCCYDFYAFCGKLVRVAATQLLEYSLCSCQSQHIIYNSSCSWKKK